MSFSLPHVEKLGPLWRVYTKLIAQYQQHPDTPGGEFSACFTELQRDFVSCRPTKLKDLLRLVKHWYKQVCMGRRSQHLPRPRAPTLCQAGPSRLHPGDLCGGTPLSNPMESGWVESSSYHQSCCLGFPWPLLCHPKRPAGCQWPCLQGRCHGLACLQGASPAFLLLRAPN